MLMIYTNVADGNSTFLQGRKALVSPQHAVETSQRGKYSQNMLKGHSENHDLRSRSMVW